MSIKLTGYQNRMQRKFKGRKNYNYKNKKKKVKWEGIWWKNPALIYSGSITVPPKPQALNNPTYRHWRKCAWALIYDPYTPDWLRVILKMKVRLRRPFNRKLFKALRGIRMYKQRWTKYTFKKRSKRLQAKIEKVERYHEFYRSYEVIQKRYIDMHDIPMPRIDKKSPLKFKIANVGAYTYLKAFDHFDRFKRYQKLGKFRRRRRRYPSFKRARYSYTLYTVRFLRSSLKGLMLYNKLIKWGYSRRTTYNANLLPLRTLRQFLRTLRYKRLKTHLLRWSSHIRAFFFKFNVRLDSFKLRTYLHTKLIVVNNKKADWIQSLYSTDIITIKKEIAYLKNTILSWNILQSWKYWILNIKTRIKKFSKYNNFYFSAFDIKTLTLIQQNIKSNIQSYAYLNNVKFFSVKPYKRKNKYFGAYFNSRIKKTKRKYFRIFKIPKKRMEREKIISEKKDVWMLYKGGRRLTKVSDYNFKMWTRACIKAYSGFDRYGNWRKYRWWRKYKKEFPKKRLKQDVQWNSSYVYFTFKKKYKMHIHLKGASLFKLLINAQKKETKTF